jgi:hypothetical protein
MASLVVLVEVVVLKITMRVVLELLVKDLLEEMVHHQLLVAEVEQVLQDKMHLALNQVLEALA